MESPDRKKTVRMSSPNRKSKTNDENGDVEASTVRKIRSFKRIRGFLSGESRRERRARKVRDRATASAARGTGSTPSIQNSIDMSEDEDSTHYDVDVEDRSVSSRLGPSSPLRLKPAANPNMLRPSSSEEAAMEDHEAFFSSAEFKKPYLLKVVLLLMDPQTRRFELLQLEFDSLKALVSDVLAQIPVSVTEDALRMQTYSGICGHDGLEMTSDKLLATFCHGNDVLVALPTGFTAKDCARLAKPILGDEKVGAMLLSSGIDSKPWRDEFAAKKTKKAPIESESESSEIEFEPRSSFKEKAVLPVEEKSSGSGSSGLFVVVSVVLVAILLQVFHLYISAPIRPGHIVSPGIWLSKCGILGFWPECENQYLKMDDKGTVTLYNSKHEVAWQLEGGICAKDNEKCVPGMHVNLDNTIDIGGTHVSWVSMYESVPLSPWPFAESPKVKIWKKSKP